MNTIETLKSRARFEYTLKCGDVITVRRIAIDGLIARGVAPPSILTGGASSEGGTDLLAEDPTAIKRMVDATILEGVDMPFYFGPPPCPPDMIELSDLHEDRWDLFNFICEKSDLDALVKRRASFRDAPAGAGEGDRSDGGSDGGELSPGDADVARGVGV